MATNNLINNSVKVTRFLSSGTWTKDPRAQLISVFAWDGGNGGGSGRQGTDTQSGGGAGGTMGSSFYLPPIPSSTFGATETVTVGSGGAGGAVQSTADTDGNPGGLGSQSNMGNLVTAAAVNTAPGGSTVQVSGPSQGGSILLGYVNSIDVENAQSAGNGDIVAGGNSFSANENGLNMRVMNGSSGGGGGGADVTIPRTGGNGGDIYRYESTVFISGGLGGSGGTPNGNPGNDAPTSGGVLTAGTGGGGGAGQSLGNVAGAGGHGGFPCAGGGGGGGSLDGLPSGAGGNGGDGLIIVCEYF